MQIMPIHFGKKDIACCVLDPKTKKYRLGKCSISDPKDPCQNIGIGILLLWSCLNRTKDLYKCNSTNGGFSVIDDPCFKNCTKDYTWPP